MVRPERIILDQQVFIFLLETEINGELKTLWMLSINGAGRCGRASSETESINDILKLTKLSDGLRVKIKGCRNKETIKTIENVPAGKTNNYIQMDLFG